jgi:hypothetical protein
VTPGGYRFPPRIPVPFSTNGLSAPDSAPQSSRWRPSRRPEIDLAEIIAGKGSKEHLAVRRRGDTVGTGAPRRIELCHLACFGVEPAIDALLPGEPEHALSTKTLLYRAPAGIGKTPRYFFGMSRGVGYQRGQPADQRGVAPLPCPFRGVRAG